MLVAKVTRPQAGWPYDQQQIKDLIAQEGDKYIEVHYIAIGRSSTDVNLYPNKTKQYNSVNFSFYIKEGDKYREIDIFKEVHPRIHYTYSGF